MISIPKYKKDSAKPPDETKVRSCVVIVK